jgi:hypothetical protein
MKSKTQVKLRRLIERLIREETQKWQIEAYGVKGMQSKSWRKIFNSPEQLEKWCDVNDAEVQGTSYLLNGREIQSSMPEYQNLPDNFKGE